MDRQELAWKRATFWSKLMLFLDSLWIYRRAFKPGIWRPTSTEQKESADACVALSSTCYSIASSTFARVKNIKAPERTTDSLLLLTLFTVLDTLWCLFTWAPLGAICYAGTLPLCKKARWHVGYAELSPEQLDVCQSILRSWGRYEEAYTCIALAFDNIRQCRQRVRPHTLGLLIAGLVEIHDKRCDVMKAWRDCDEAIYFAGEAEKEGELEQAARIYRQCARTMTNLGATEDADKVIKRAEALARQAGSQDQLSKLP